MSIFLDAGNVNEIRKYHSYGFIRGVITNSTNSIKVQSSIFIIIKLINVFKGR